MRGTQVCSDANQKYRCALLLILAVAVALRFYDLASESLWFDEAYSVWVARHSVSWHLALSTQRIFPVLYYLLLHFWLWLGSSDFVVRTLSVFVGVGSIVIAYALAKSLFNDRVALFSALALAVSPLHIWYSQEARMYILVSGLGLASAYLMWLALEGGGAGAEGLTVRGQLARRVHWMAYVLVSAAAIHAHYFAVFLLLFQNAYVLYLLLRSWPVLGSGSFWTKAQRAMRVIPWKPWLVSQVAVGGLSVVGFAGMFSDESRYWWGLLDTWRGAPTWRHLLRLMFSFSLGTTVENRWLFLGGLLLFGTSILIGLVPPQELRFLRASAIKALFADKGLVFILLYLLMPVGTVFLYSQYRSSWVLRYLFPYLPPYAILVGRGIARLPGRWAGPLLAGTIVLVSLWPIANVYRYQQKEDWRSAAGYISDREQPGDGLLLVDEDIWIPLGHYYRGSMSEMAISRDVTDRSLLAARLGLAISGHNRIWLVLSHTNNTLVRDLLMSSPEVELESARHFVGVEVDLFAVRSLSTDGG